MSIIAVIITGILILQKRNLKNVKRKIHTEEFKEIFDDAFVYDKEKAKNFLVKFDEDNRCKFLK